MRTERPEPWGFDLYDPRLTIRQQAADAQRKYAADQTEPDEPDPLDEEPSSQPQERESVGGRSR